MGRNVLDPCHLCPGGGFFWWKKCLKTVSKMSKNRPAIVPEVCQKAAISVSEMAHLCRLSRSRFYGLIRGGVFPRPIQENPGKRPYYPLPLIQQCLDIRQTGIGQSGQVVLFNRPAQKKPQRKRPATLAPATDYTELAESLKALGLTVTGDIVHAAIQSVFPGGVEGVDPGEVVRRVFLHLQGRRS